MMQHLLSRSRRWQASLVLGAILNVITIQAIAEVQSRGKQLAEIHCIRCHLLPDPHDLPKNVWPKRLADMGMYLGFEGDELPDIKELKPAEQRTPRSLRKTIVYSDERELEISAYKSWIPATPMISVEDWIEVRNYFVDNAPLMEELVLPQPDHPTLTGFEAVEPDLEVEPNALVVSTRVDEANDILYIGRSIGRQMDEIKEGTEDLLAIDIKSGKRLARKELATAPTNIELTDTGIRLSGHGEFPIVPGSGESYITDLVGFASGETIEHMLVYGKHRIIQAHTVDMNGDGLADIVTNMFGDGIYTDHGGGLSIFWQEPFYAQAWKNAPAQIPAGVLTGALRDEQLINQVGAIGSTIADFDNDGRPDVALLVAQALQQVIVYYNRGDGRFQQEILAQYSPSFGGNSIYAEDLDGDGNTDLVFLNGDNVYSNFVGGRLDKPKPYHGVTVFKNKGGRSFEQAYFYAMHGATRAAVADYDGDGDQDIAAISMYPDWRWDVPETFVYLENVGGLQFQPASLSRDNFAVWLSIEAADVNGDERPDIVLGLGDWPKFTPKDWTTREIMQGRGPDVPSIMYLLNRH
jgi:hypothetical protein